MNSVLYRTWRCLSRITIGGKSGVGSLSAISAANYTTNSDITVQNASGQDIDEHGLERKRNKSGLPSRLYQKYIKKEMPPLQYKYTFEGRYLKRMYAMFGAKSGLNPGIMWETREELKDKIEYDNVLYTPLQEMMDNVKRKREEEQEMRKNRELSVEKAMALLEKEKERVLERRKKKIAEAEAQRKKKQQLIEEVRQFLGYNIDPRDERFKEALEAKELEEKKAQKELKRKQKHDKMMERLLGEAKAQMPSNKEVAPSNLDKKV